MTSQNGSGWTRAKARRALLIIGVPILSGLLLAILFSGPSTSRVADGTVLTANSLAGDAVPPPTDAPEPTRLPAAVQEPPPAPPAPRPDVRPTVSVAEEKPAHESAKAPIRAASPARVPSETPAMAQGRPSITPEALKPIVGPLVLRGSGPSVAGLRVYDDRFARTELARYQEYLKVEQDRQGSFLLGQHYGGLMSRLMWSIRNGQPIGPAAPPEAASAYARGRRIVRRYLEWSKVNNFAVPPHNNTGLADVEALYVLEGDELALTHIHVSAMSPTTDRYGYWKFTNKGSDARQVAVALQAFMAAHRLGIPYERSPANNQMGFDKSLGSWVAAGQRQIGWIRQNALKPDGSIPSPAHDGNEAYLFNALLATRLLEWCANIEWDQSVFDMARLMMDHVIAAQRPGWPALGYQSNSGQAATDLAAFYIWPSLVMWQETGEPKYRDFAVLNINASSKAYIDQMKQWNQAYSTLGQGAEALLAGVPWR